MEAKLTPNTGPQLSKSCDDVDGASDPSTPLSDSDPDLEFIQNQRSLARRSFDARQYANLEPVLQTIMEKSEDKYGPEFSWRDETVEMRAAACWEQGKWDEADVLFDQQFKGRGKLLETLAREAINKGKRRSAERLLNKHFDGREGIMELIADAYIQEGKWKEAKPLLVELLQDETDQNTRLRRKLTLAYICFILKDFGEAEAWCLKAVIGSQTTLGERHPQFYKSVNLLAQIYNAEGTNIQADSYESVLSDLSPGLHGISL
jgi:tetratricopeptide (TPR) repeat protein